MAKIFGALLSIDEARRRVAAALTPIARTETVPLDEAVGRVAAADIVSSADVPPFARAAMDGYAVVAADTAGASRQQPARLRVAGSLSTGQVASTRVGHGRAMAIATGAPMPDGADAVVIVEDTADVGDGQVAIFAPAVAGQNIGRRGADIPAGAAVVHAGDRLTPARVGAIAAIGRGDLLVYAKPRVAILSTGNEIAAPGRPLEPGQIYDVNRYTVASVAAAHGGAPEPQRTAADTVDALSRALDACLSADLVVFSGGTSVGERDLTLDLLAARGEVLFHGLDIKPGKPTAFAVVGRKPVFGLPGYPTSCLLNAYLLFVPALQTVARLPPYSPRTRRAPLARRIANTSGRRYFSTVRLENGEAQPAFKASGDITSLSQADGYVEIPPEVTAIEQGTEVVVTLF